MSDKSLRALGEALRDDMRAFLHALGTGWLEHEDRIDQDWLALDALAAELALSFQPGDEWVTLDIWLTSGFMPVDLLSASEALSPEHTAQAGQAPRRAAIPPGAIPVTSEWGQGPQRSQAGRGMAPPPLAQRQLWRPQVGVTFWPVGSGRAQPPMASPPTSPWSDRGAPWSDPGQQVPAVMALTAGHAEPDTPAPAPQSAPPSQLSEQPMPLWPQQVMRVSSTDTAGHEESQASGPPGGAESQRRPSAGRAQERADGQAVETPGQPKAAVLVPRADKAATIPPALQRTTPGPVQGLRALAAWLDSTPAAGAPPVVPGPPLPARAPEDTPGPVQHTAVASPARAHSPIASRDRAEGEEILDAGRYPSHPHSLPEAAGDAVPSVRVPGGALRLEQEASAMFLEPDGERGQQPLQRHRAEEEPGRRVTDVLGHVAAGESPRGSVAVTGGGSGSHRMPPVPVAPTAAVLTPPIRQEVADREAATAPPALPHAVLQAGPGRQVLAALQDAAPTAAVCSPAVPGTTLPVPARADMPAYVQHPSADIPQHTQSPLPRRSLPSPHPHMLPVGEGERGPYPPGLLAAELPAASQGYAASPVPDGAASQHPQGVIQFEDTAPPLPVRTTSQPVQGLQALAALLEAASTAPASPERQHQSLSHQRPAAGSQPTRPQEAQPFMALPLPAARVDAASVAWERPVTAGDAGRSQAMAGSDRTPAAQSASPTPRGATPQPQEHSTRPRVEAWHSQPHEPLNTLRPDHPRRGLQPLPGQARQRQTTAEDLFPADLSPGDEPPAAAPPADGAASVDTPRTRGSEGGPLSQQPGHDPAPSARALRTDDSSALAARVVHWTEDIDLDGILEALAREIQQEYRRFYGD